ncbi:hypothetical protein CHELA20_53958 [Hyphomicrobiales bacterium]|nr:hypothetical protein CHELA41_20968 [Hyphomicrobiales bacterium]CAH1685304.1 hypothetical protein CHELA20_53958 [Hyphomicrobiales bacterium]
MRVFGEREGKERREAAGYVGGGRAVRFAGLVAIGLKGPTPMRVLVRYRYRSEQSDELALGIGVTIDIALRGLDRAMSGQHLDIPQATAGTVEIARGLGDETAASGMGRAADQAQGVIEAHKKIDDAVRPQRSAATRDDDGTIEDPRSLDVLQSSAQIRMNGNPTSAALLGDGIPDAQHWAHPTFVVEHHRPIETGDLTGSQPGLHRQQHDDAITLWLCRHALHIQQHAPERRRTNNLGLPARHGVNLRKWGECVRGNPEAGRLWSANVTLAQLFHNGTVAHYCQASVDDPWRPR